MKNWMIESRVNTTKQTSLNRLLLAVISLVVVVGGLGTPCYAALDSKGTEFWLTFPGNFNGGSTLNLFITGDANTSGTVDIPGLGFSTPFTVTAGTVTTVALPSGADLGGLSDVITNLGIHVTALNEVTVYGLNRVPFTTDAYLGLPVDILGTDYINLGFGNVNIVNGTQFAIVGTVNGTTVTITPSVTTGARVVGVPYSITLNQGEVYQLRNTGSQPNDLSGTLISSDQPIAVFGSHQCANIPNGSTLACDHIVEQLTPTVTWGKNFVTEPLATRLNGDTFRIIASVNGTTVNINGVPVATLNKGQFTQQLITGPSQITADQPVMVAQYSNGTTFDGVTSDPFMMLIPPYEQFLGNYTVTTPASGFSTNFINIVVPNAAVGAVTLDAVPVPPGSYTAIGVSGFSGAQLAVGLGSHNLAGPLPFGTFVYGFDNADSYGYPGGMSLSPIVTATTLLLDPKSATNQVGQTHCVNATVLDQHTNVVVGVRVDFSVTGANTTAGFSNTDSNGVAAFCYVGTNPGADNIQASVGTLQDTAEKIWLGGATPQISCDLQFSTTNGEQIVSDPCGEADAGVPVGTTVFVSPQICADAANTGSVSNFIVRVIRDGTVTNTCSVFGLVLDPGQCLNACFISFNCDTPGVHTFEVTVTAQANCSACVTTTCFSTFECCAPPPPCPTCDGGVVTVNPPGVTINFNTNPPTYSGDPALLPYFTYDNSGPTPDTWKAIFDVVGKQLLLKSGATIKTTQVPANTNNRRAPGIVIKSTCSVETEPGSYIAVGSLNRQAGNILIQVDGPVTINGVVSNSVDGTMGRPGNITIGTQCGDILTGPKSKVITYGQDYGGSDINLANCESGNIVINGLVDASYKAKQASKINIASFGGSVSINGKNVFGTEVVAGALRTVTSGVSVRSRRDPLPGTIEIQAASDIYVQGSTLLDKNYPNYGAVAVKTMSTGSKGGLIDARAGGNITLIDRALDNANRYNTAAVNRALAGGGIQLTVSGSVDNGASDIGKPVVNVQGGSGGQGGTNELRGEGSGVNVGAGAKVLADSTGPNGSVGANIISGCTGVTEAGVVSPADGAGDNTGVCGVPDPLFLDCGELGIVFAQ